MELINDVYNENKYYSGSYVTCISTFQFDQNFIYFIICQLQWGRGNLNPRCLERIC